MQVCAVPSYDVLRRIRLRLDVVAMLAWRHWLAQLMQSGKEWSVYVWMDASPQWRGKELFAASFDLIVVEGDERNLYRRLFPLINIGPGYRGIYGKV